MKTTSYLAMISAALLMGCASTHETVWVQDGASDKQFRMDTGQCGSQVYAMPFSTEHQKTMFYLNCMRGKGWHRESRPKNS